MKVYGFFLAGLFLAFDFFAFTDAVLLAGAFAPLAANRAGAPSAGVPLGATVPLGVPPAPFGAAVPLGAPAALPVFAFLRPHLPKVRIGAAASIVWHSGSVRLLGSL